MTAPGPLGSAPLGRSGARVEGKVALVTGAARSQGRAHAVRLAMEGADVIAVDICAPIGSVTPEFYPGATPEDLAETVRQAEALDRRIVARQADVRDVDALGAAVDEGVAELGRLDIVCANAGIFTQGKATEIPEQSWQDMLDVNLTGVWHTCKVAIPHIQAGGRGGSIIITSSGAGFKGLPNTAHYTSTKHGLVGLMRTLANEYADQWIRVNTVHPTNVDTIMIQNEATWRLFAPDKPQPTRDDAAAALASFNALPIPWVEAGDISNAVLFLASDEARYITGATLPVDAGMSIK